MLGHFIRFYCYRVEIIRLSDKSFKETIKDVELSSFRSTSKEGYISLDPSKPLPHEFAEGKLSRYNDNIRQKYSNTLEGLKLTNKLSKKPMDDEQLSKIIAHYTNANDSVILNKTEFREILMNALNANKSIIDQFNMTELNVLGDDISDGDLIAMETPELETDDIIYMNQTIENSPPTTNSDVVKKVSAIPLDAPEVDKLLNEGKTHFNCSIDIPRENCWVAPAAIFTTL